MQQLTLMQRQAIQRRHAQKIAAYLSEKRYRRDVPNNTFKKQYGKGFYEYYEIGYQKEFICIWDMDKHKITFHKIKFNEQSEKARTKDAEVQKETKAA